MSEMEWRQTQLVYSTAVLWSTLYASLHFMDKIEPSLVLLALWEVKKENS